MWWLVMAVLVSEQVAVTHAVGQCEQGFIPSRNLETDWAACTAACNADGYCCTNTFGGCQNPTCSTGCHIAWHVKSMEACLEECASVSGCEYVHPVSKTVFHLCAGHDSCGCPAQPPAGQSDWGLKDDCGGSGCARACELANNIFGVPFYGRPLTQTEKETLEEQDSAAVAELLGALAQLKQHVTGKTLSNTAVVAVSTKVEEHKLLLNTQTNVIEAALDLVEAFESSEYGPLFILRGPFQREGFGDGRDTDRAMLVVQQLIMDNIYNAGTVADCSRSLFDRRKWKTSEHFPGAVSPPEDPTEVHSVKINATNAPMWGWPVAFAGEMARKPTGLYLAPGELATIEVPLALAGAGFQVLVGSHTVDNSNKDTHLRMDRVSTKFDIKQELTLVANPLGGNIYILVPHNVDIGVVTVRISGGVVLAPLFQRNGIQKMTYRDWTARRSAPGRFADFETDRFMLTVPRSWVYAFERPVALMRDYNRAMDAVAEVFGYPPGSRINGVHTLYLQNDLHIQHDAFGIGYPQVNTLFYTEQQYNGNYDHWLLRDPAGDSTCYHELGHVQLFQQTPRHYPGEVEAINNYMLTYIRHVKFCDDFNTAFLKAQDHTNYEPDDAAVHWMITDNFRKGNPMGRANDETDEMRYQDRGFAKYADVTRLFGWEAFTAFYHQENVNYMAGVHPNDNRPEGAGDDWQLIDGRTLRWSLSVGEDLSPLMHFWGMHATYPELLQQEIQAAGLKPSLRVRCLLRRYKELIPMSRGDFNSFFEKIHPGKPVDEFDNPLYGKGWFHVQAKRYTRFHGNKAQKVLDNILDSYFSGPASCAGVETGQGTNPVSRPTSYSWLPSVWSCKPKAPHVNNLCTIPNCSNCNQGQTQCVQCALGFKLKNGACVCSIANCDVCASPGGPKCKKCRTGFKRIKGACSKFLPCKVKNCTACNYKGTKCNTCAPGYRKVKRKCVKK